MPLLADFCTAIFMDGSSARLRRRKLKSLQSCGAVKFYAYEKYIASRYPWYPRAIYRFKILFWLKLRL